MPSNTSSRWLLPSVFLLAPLLGPLGCAASTPRPMGIESETAELPPERPAEPRAAAPVMPPVATKEARHSMGQIKRAELNAVLDGAPGRFLAHVDTEPRFVAGRFRGWRLASFFPGDSRFAGVDLQAGDVVLTVNGKPIEQPEQLMHVWDSLRVERTLVVAIERDGQPRTLRYEIRD